MKNSFTNFICIKFKAFFFIPNGKKFFAGEYFKALYKETQIRKVRAIILRKNLLPKLKRQIRIQNLLKIPAFLTLLQQHSFHGRRIQRLCNRKYARRNLEMLRLIIFSNYRFQCEYDRTY